MLNPSVPAFPSLKDPNYRWDFTKQPMLGYCFPTDSPTTDTKKHDDNVMVNVWDTVLTKSFG